MAKGFLKFACTGADWKFAKFDKRFLKPKGGPDYGCYNSNDLVVQLYLKIETNIILFELILKLMIERFKLNVVKTVVVAFEMKLYDC